MAKKKELPIVQDLRDLLRKAPFEGLTLKTSDGDTVDVIHQDYLFIAPSGSTIHVYDEDQHLYIINARQLVSFVPGRQAKRKTAG